MKILQSVILDCVKKTAKKAVGLCCESFSGKTFTKLNNSLDEGIEKSSVVGFFTKIEKSDVYYNKISDLTVGKMMTILNKIFGFLSDGVRKSGIFCFLKYVCENFFVIPLFFYGITLLFSGAGALVGSLLFNRGMVSVILSVAMIVCGGILMLIKKSISHLFGGSVIFGIIFKLLKAPEPELISKNDVKKRITKMAIQKNFKI